MDFLHSHRSLNTWAREFQHGNGKAAEKLFNYFYPLIYRYARSRLSDKEVAVDIAQEVFLKITRNIQAYDEARGNVSVWIWQIARNVLRDHFRHSARVASQTETSLDIMIDNFAEEEKDPLIKHEVQEIMEILKEFTEEDQELFRLRFVAELSYEEISEITGRSENALRVALHRIKEKLRQEYKY